MNEFVWGRVVKLVLVNCLVPQVDVFATIVIFE